MSSNPNEESMTTPTVVISNSAPADTAALNLVTLKQLLTDLVKVDGITTAVLVSRDGFVIDGASNGNSLDLEVVGAVVSAGIGSNIAIGKELHVGDIRQSMTEYEKGFIVATVLGEAGALAVVADLKANLGHVRYHVKKHAAMIGTLV